MNQICIDLKPTRYMSELYLNEKVDVTNLVKYIKEEKEKGNKITYFHAFSLAIGKTIYNRPLLNRFVANRHIYEHNDVSLSFVMKIDFTDKSEELMVVMPVEEKDNIFSWSEKIGNKVNSIREKKDSGTGANDIIQIVGKMPNPIRIPIVGFLKWLDKKGKLPSSIIEDNLYYSSMILSNLGSLKCGAIYHNVTEFGTCPGLITMGEIKEEEVIINGKKEKRYFCDFGMTMDERTSDGFYLIKSIKLMEYILDNPKLLEGKANEKIEFEG
jgi:pyruvate/2-oxoglutarate dehydrogenase complex dihydrolipoamide acyltransferase (E2) component